MFGLLKSKLEAPENSQNKLNMLSIYGVFFSTKDEDVTKKKNIMKTLLE